MQWSTSSCTTQRTYASLPTRSLFTIVKVRQGLDQHSTISDESHFSPPRHLILATMMPLPSFLCFFSRLVSSPFSYISSSFAVAEQSRAEQSRQRCSEVYKRASERTQAQLSSVLLRRHFSSGLDRAKRKSRAMERQLKGGEYFSGYSQLLIIAWGVIPLHYKPGRNLCQLPQRPF